MKKVLSILILMLAVIISCSDENESEISNDNFDRKAMLMNWADNIIIPGYTAYVNELAELKTAKDNFITSPDAETLEDIRSKWLDAYITWQRVSIFEIGKAEQLALRDFSNVYPANVSEIENNISSGDYNLELPSSRDEQGFPAVDYLLYGIEASDDEIISRFQSDNSLNSYLSQTVDRLDNLANEVLDDWNNGYRDTFVNNDGSSATSSVNKLVNDYMFYYEKALRAGKIGIPAGVFSSTPLSDKVEGLYSKEYSKVLFNEALDATVDFFNGNHYNSNESGESLKTYLEFLNSVTEGEPLATLINQQFATAKNTATGLDDNFYQQVESNNDMMLMTYDELQKNVVLMKVDMFQALSVKVDFVDADGD